MQLPIIIMYHSQWHNPGLEDGLSTTLLWQSCCSPTNHNYVSSSSLDSGFLVKKLMYSVAKVVAYN